MDNKKDVEIKKIEIDLSIKNILGISFMFLFLFIFPIQIIYYQNNPSELAPSVLGITSDNSGRYFNIPLINFNFDTHLTDPATISVVFVSLLVTISIILIIIFFIDFKNRERKYRN